MRHLRDHRLKMIYVDMRGPLTCFNLRREASRSSGSNDKTLLSDANNYADENVSLGYFYSLSSLSSSSFSFLIISE